MGRRRKNKIYQGIEITGIADKGKAVGRTEEGEVIFVKGVVPGDVVDVLRTKKRSKYMEGRVVDYQSYSDDRVEPFCEHFNYCGGCDWQNMAYETQLKHKHTVVENAILRLGKAEPKEFLPIVGCEDTTFYRNKMEFSFSCKRWLSPEELNDETISNREDVLGFHPKGAFDKIIDINKCWLQPDPSNAIRLESKRIAIEQELSFFDAYLNEGFMRNMIIRMSTTGELMLIYAFYENDQDAIKNFLDAILKSFPEITSLFYVINPKKNDFLLDLDYTLYHGKDHIIEQLGEVKFKVGPKSFFQTNSKQAKVLYDKVVEFAGLDGTQNVYDLYTGVGSIALYVSKYAKHVVGVEEVPTAIEDAKVNMAMNGIDNCTFYAGDVKAILTDSFAEEHGAPDLVITDPPRAGMHGDVVDMFLKLESPRIVYVSCNPATQGRDIQLLSEKYDLIKVQAVDMFPNTHHIESVALLELRK